MLGIRTSLVVAGALAAGLLVAAPAQSTPGTRTYWMYDGPGTVVESANAVNTQDDTDDVGVQATVSLLTDPPAGSELRLAFGVLDDAGACTVQDDGEIVVPLTGSRTLEIDGEVEMPYDATCSYVAVTESDGSVVDRVDGRIDHTEDIYYGDDEQIRGLQHRRVPVGRWSWLGVRLSFGETVDRVRVSGDRMGQKGVRIRSASRDLSGSPMTIRIPVNLTAHHARIVVVTAVFRGDTGPTTRTIEARLAPRR